MSESAVTDEVSYRASSETAEGKDDLAGVPRSTFEFATNQSSDIASEIRKQVNFLRYISGDAQFGRSGRS